jgi:DNA-binding response OmpR family regulator
MDNGINIIVVEDQDAVREVIVASLRGKGHHVVGVESAEVFNEVQNTMRVDMMVIDLNLPGEDGLSLTRRVRSSMPKTGIILLTARNALSQRLDGYESGADMYLTKPASIDELNGSIKAIYQRMQYVCTG